LLTNPRTPTLNSYATSGGLLAALGGIMKLTELYESETGEKAIYHKGSSDYHTLRYVQWLENRASQQPNAVDGNDVMQNYVPGWKRHDSTDDAKDYSHR